MARISNKQKAVRKRINERRLNVISLKLGLADQNGKIFREMFSKNPFTKRTFETIKKLEKNISSGKVNDYGEFILPSKKAALVKRTLISKIDPNMFERKETVNEIKNLRDFRVYTEIISRNDFYKENKNIIESYNSIVSEKGYSKAQTSEESFDLKDAKDQFIAKRKRDLLSKK